MDLHHKLQQHDVAELHDVPISQVNERIFPGVGRLRQLQLSASMLG